MTGLDHRFDQDESKVLFRQSVRRFLAAEAEPHLDRWEAQGNVDRAFWQKAGAAGLLCPTVPEIYGGPGLDFSYNAIVTEEHGYARVPSGITLQSDIAADYILHYGSEAQKRRWLPAMVSGTAIAAIAMTEPGVGSDLKAIATSARCAGDHYVINGAKTYITNGQNADLILVCAKTDTEVQPAWKGVSIILVESDREGFARGRNLDKLGMEAQDTSELFFDDVTVPQDALLGGREGQGFYQLMGDLPYERLIIGLAALACMEGAYEATLAYVRERRAFGKALQDMPLMQRQLDKLRIYSEQARTMVLQTAQALQRSDAGEDGAYALLRILTPMIKFRACRDARKVTGDAMEVRGGCGYIEEWADPRLVRDAHLGSIWEGTSNIVALDVAETERSYTKLTVAEKMRLQFDNIVSDNKKSARKSTAAGTKFR